MMGGATNIWLLTEPRRRLNVVQGER